jgi:hypothetical protein
MKSTKVLAARFIGGVMGTIGRNRRDATKAHVFTRLTLGIAVAMLFMLTETARADPREETTGAISALKPLAPCSLHAVSRSRTTASSKRRSASTSLTQMNGWSAWRS